METIKRKMFKLSAIQLIFRETNVKSILGEKSELNRRGVDCVMQCM